MGSLGTTELIIILVIIIVLFGVGRLTKIGSELGKGISAFREGVREGKEENNKTDDNIIE